MTQPASNAIGKHITFMALGDDPEMFDEDFVRLLSDLTVEEDVPQGTVIQAKGQPTERLHLVTEGEICDAGKVYPMHPILHGLDGAVMKGRYRRTLMARTRARVLSIDTASFFALLEDQLPTATIMLSTLAGRVEQSRSFEPLSGPVMSFTTALVCRALALRTSRTFASVSAESIVNLARMSSATALEPGESLTFSRSGLHVLMTGALVGARKDSDEPLHYSGLTLVNAAATFAGNLEAYSAKAEVPSTYIVIDREDLYTEIRYHFSLWRALVAGMLQENAFFSDHAAPSRRGDSLR
jgi:CRP-like cAMP-binding protein